MKSPDISIQNILTECRNSIETPQPFIAKGIDKKGVYFTKGSRKFYYKLGDKKSQIFAYVLANQSLSRKSR